MTHLPYIVASYGLTIVVISWLAIGAWRRNVRARHMLNELDRREMNKRGRA